jgi:hypothetical protein
MVTFIHCAFLSTPFVAIRPKDQAVSIFYGIAIVLAVTFSTLYPYTYVRVFGGDYLSNALLLYPSALLIFGIVGWFFIRTGKKYEKPNQIFDEARQWQTADIPAGNYLFLRCSGDEAAAGLSALQLIAWINLKVSQFLALVARWVIAS